MNTDTGLVMDSEMAKRLTASAWEDLAPVFKLIELDSLSPRARAQLAATGVTHISRNSPCPCGSRKRFKRCCMTGKGRR